MKRESAARSIVDQFKQIDCNGQGLIHRSAIVTLLHRTMHFSPQDINRMLEAADVEENGKVRYEAFVQWLLEDDSFSSACSGKLVCRRIEEIADSLTNIASWMAARGASASSEIYKHAESLREICKVSIPMELAAADRAASAPIRTEPEEASAPGSATGGNDPFLNLLKRKLTARRPTIEQLTFREKAAMVVEQTGQQGDMVDDLEEIAITAVEDKLAISYWRFCEGVRLYRSKTVTQALRLICQAPVPGLGEVSYLDVFSTLSSTEWRNHIYLFGGLVRDILRRLVGNDIDIAFSAPAAELEAMCQANGYKCHLDGDYILIGDESGEEYLEGMVISFNGIQASYHADFSMNTLFYDFANDIIIDKTGVAIPAVVANQVAIPCPRDKWDCWFDINGARVSFRYFKFILRGYSYESDEMAYVTQRLLEFWRHNAESTIEIGRIALGSLVSCKDAEKIERLRRLVSIAFTLAAKSRATSRRNGRSASMSSVLNDSAAEGGVFFSASAWWHRGWLCMLKLAG